MREAYIEHQRLSHSTVRSSITREMSSLHPQAKRYGVAVIVECDAHGKPLDGAFERQQKLIAQSFKATEIAAGVVFDYDTINVCPMVHDAATKSYRGIISAYANPRPIVSQL